MTRDEGTICPECQSTEVRPSRSSYPHDKSRMTSETTSFWRCGNCGSRFLGRLAPERKRKAHGRSGSKNQIDRTVNLTRFVKKWIFPALAILTTVIAMIYILDKRDTPPADQIIIPP